MEETFETYVSVSGKTLKIVTDKENVREISFIREVNPSTQKLRETPAPTADSHAADVRAAKTPAILRNAALQLEEYLLGKREEFNLALAPEGTDFQKKVWKLLQSIPFGKTVTYARIAAQLGDPKVIRAAASANGKNPIAIVIPCHRVIGSDGSLTGYAGGLENKRFLLELERANGVLTLFSEKLRPSVSSG